jgi:hypothetical protein
MQHMDAKVQITPKGVRFDGLRWRIPNDASAFLIVRSGANRGHAGHQPARTHVTTLRAVLRPSTPPQKLNSVQTSAGPVNVDRDSNNATMQSIGVSRSSLLSEGDVCGSVLRSSAQLPAGNGMLISSRRHCWFATASRCSDRHSMCFQRTGLDLPALPGEFEQAVLSRSAPTMKLHPTPQVRLLGVTAPGKDVRAPANVV